jgi:release factor glutamine methyltransferase
MNIAAVLLSARRILEKNGIYEARREANLLLTNVLDKDMAFLIAHSDQELPADKYDLFISAITRRAAHEPLQYILGWQQFCGHDFVVGPGVLIPRPETEMLVNAAVQFLSAIENPRFIDIGVGSGCIAVSVLSQVPEAHATGVDISTDSIACAAKNAERMDVRNRLHLTVGDLFGLATRGRFHAVISNPPYVPIVDLTLLEPEVKDFEPHLALTDGGTGLSIINRIVDQAPNYLLPGGCLILEFGFGQSRDVTKMFDTLIWPSVDIQKDFRSIERMVVATLA